MVTDTFFDLQRFDDGDEPVTTTALLDATNAKDTLVGSSVNGGTFTWQNGRDFLGKDGTTVNAGTTDNPAHIVAAGNGTASLVGSDQIVLSGTPNGYSFAVNEDKTNWEISLKGSENVIRGDFSQADGAYGLNGEAVVTVLAGKSFNETLNGNGNTTYVRASNTANVPVTVSSAGGASINYALEGSIPAAVVVDINDTAVIKGAANSLGTAQEMTLGAAATPNPQAASIPGAYFYHLAVDTVAGNVAAQAATASITSPDNVAVKISVKDSVNVVLAGDTWSFANKSTRDDAVLIVNDPNATDNAKIFTGEVSSVAATKGVTVNADDDGIETPVNVNGKQWTRIIAEEDPNDLLTVIFDESGNATIDNIDATGLAPRVNGGVTVDGAAGATAEFDTITATGVIANGAKIQANGAVDDIQVTLEAGGISAIGMDLADAPVTITGDANKSFEAKLKNANDVFGVTTSADSIAVDINAIAAPGTGTNNDPPYLYVNGNALRTTVEHNQAYNVTGGEAIYNTETVVAGGQMAVSINGAAVQLNNNDANNADGYILTSDSKKAGIDEAMLLKPNDAIRVTGDSDGFTAIYAFPTAAQVANDDVLTYAVNDATISVHASDVDSKLVTVVAGGDNQVTIQGIEGNATVTVASAGGTTYHFKNELTGNKVSVSSATEFVQVTLSGSGDVMKVPTAGRVDDLIDDNDQPRVNADETKWQEIATVGGSTVFGGVEDTVETHHANVYKNFYDLVASSVGSNTIAGFENPDDENPVDGSSNINIIGESPLTNPTPVAEAAHVTLSGTPAIGSVPINIQQNESTNAKDVTVALGNSSVPSTVAVGTEGVVTASHNIQLSNAGTPASPSYGYLGSGATGQNVMSVSTGAAMLRHDGDNRASLLGGSNNDTIRGSQNDIVSGGASTDYFYDLSGYALDYNVGEGDVIIASRLSNLGEVTQANIWGQGNQIAFGNHGEYYLTLGNIDPNAAVHVKVATIDDDGNLMKGVKDVVLANGNGTVDATAAGDNGALIIADSTRGDGVHEILGSAGNDTIHSGSFDIVNGGTGNDDIYIENGAGAPGAVVVLGSGDDSVTGWTFGFDRAEGATQLYAGGLDVRGRVFEDRMYVSLVGGEASILFNDTAALGNSDSATMHGQYDILVDNKKFTMIRNGDARQGWAVVDSNDKIADYYMAEREGNVGFTENVTDLIGDTTLIAGMGVIDLTSENFHAIRQLGLMNNSKTFVLGSTDRETVSLGGAAIQGANKFVSLGAENDVIYSGGDGNPSVASNAFFFGAGDGRDTIIGYNHYQGVNEDPDKQSADIIVLQSFAGLKTEVDANGYTRVEFALSADTAANEYALIYEAPGNYDYNSNMYRVQITDRGSDGIAKIGYSTTANPTGTGNYFVYDKEVSFYVGSSGESRDTLVINTTNENVNIRMDSTQDVNGDGTTEFYRGIGVLDASAATYTNTTLAGSAADNIIVAGGEGTNNFLWGGAGNNTLVGGAGNDFFIYCLGANNWVEGADPNAGGNNDIVLNYNSNDVIYLGDVTIDQINAEAMAQAGGNYGITENAVTVSFKNGGSLQVAVNEGVDEVKFYMGNGQVYSAQRSTGAWQRDA